MDATVKNLMSKDVTLIAGECVKTFPRTGRVAIVHSCGDELVNVLNVGNDVMANVTCNNLDVVMMCDGDYIDMPSYKRDTYYIVKRDVAEVLRRSDLLVPKDVIGIAGGINCAGFEVLL
jgi:hypothetical protein